MSGLQTLLVRSIHLPNFVGAAGAAGVCGGPASRRSRIASQARQPAPQGSFRGDGLGRIVFCEKHTYQPGTPASVFRTHRQRFFDQRWDRCGADASAVGIVRRQLRGVSAKPVDEVANRPHR